MQKTKKKILMCDLRNIGHHFIYNSTIMMNLKTNYKIIYFTNILDNQKKMKLNNENIVYKEVKIVEYNNKILKQLSYFQFLFKAYKYAVKNKFDSIHFFTLDFILLPVLILNFFFKMQTTATLHWYPNNKLKGKLLRLVIRCSLMKLVVHGEYIKMQVAQLTDNKYIDKIISIDYPSLTDKIIRKDNNINKQNDEKVLLYFGEMRYDKGIDILISSLKHIKNNYKLIIAGRPMYFTEEYLTDLLHDFTNVTPYLGFVPDDIAEEYFTLADIVVLPYRKIFNGQSGPLTDGVKHNCLIIAPNIGQIGYTVEKYLLGVTYEAENSIALANSIDYCIENYGTIMTEHCKNFEYYNEITTVSTFIQKYDRVFS